MSLTGDSAQKLFPYPLLLDRNLILLDPGFLLPDLSRKMDIALLLRKITERQHPDKFPLLLGHEEIGRSGEGLSKNQTDRPKVEKTGLRPQSPPEVPAGLRIVIDSYPHSYNLRVILRLLVFPSKYLWAKA